MKRKPSRKPHVLDKKRTGKCSEGSKGPFASDIVMRMCITIHGIARKPWTLDKVGDELTTYFGDYFRLRTLRNVPSDALRRMFLVERMVNRVAEIRAGQKPLTPLWNWVAAGCTHGLMNSAQGTARHDRRPAPSAAEAGRARFGKPK